MSIISDDEFDNIPDEFADIEGIDWTALLAEPSRLPTATRNEEDPSLSGANLLINTDDDGPPEPKSRASSYFSEENDMDASFLAELDRVEQRALAGRPSSIVQSTRLGDFGVHPSADPGDSTPYEGGVCNSRHFPRIEPASGSAITTNTTLPCKRACPDITSDQISQTRRGKMKSNSELQDILCSYEDELICPICCDLLAAAHVGNPCGHTFCGECGWQWHVENKNQGCPCCRQLLDRSTPIIPNIAIDNTVAKHVKALALSGATEWELNGRKYRDWTTRKETWRAGAPKRERKISRLEPVPRPRSFGEGWFHEDNVGQITTYEESDVELIPRPIRRARRRRRPASSAVTFIDLR